MDYSKKEGLVLLEVSGLLPDQLEALHNFLREKMISPLKRTEIQVNGHNGTPREGVLSGCFSKAEADVVIAWVEEMKLQEKV